MDTAVEDGEPFADAFRAAIERSNRSLTDLRNRLASHGLPISLATLSSWRSGARRPAGPESLQVVDALESILGLSPGELFALIPKPNRFGSLVDPAVPYQEKVLRREFLETVEAVGSPPAEATRDLSLRLTAHVGVSGEIEKTVNARLLQVVKGRITETTVVTAAPEPTPLLPAIVDVVGARVDRRYQHPGGRLIASVFAFDRPVFAGESVMYQYTEQFPADYPSQRVAWQGTRRTVKDILIQVIFAEGMEPVWCEEYAEFEDGQVVYDVAELHDGVAHAYRTAFGPGLLGLRWSADGD